MDTLNVEYVDLILLYSVDIFCVVYNQAVSNLKNLILKFSKNMIYNISLIYSD